MRLSHLLAAALGAAVAYVVLTFEKKQPGAASGDGGAHGAFGADGTVGTYDPAAAAEALARRRVRAGRPVEPEREDAVI